MSNLPIILGGCHRSGTSLLRRILNAHSKIYCGPEVKFFRDFYNEYENDIFKHLRFSQSALSMIDRNDLLQILGRAFIEIHEIAAFKEHKTRWADKSPENVLYLNEWNQLLGDKWLFIQIIRNPLDVISSMKEANFNLTIPHQISDQIYFYLKYVKAGLAFQQSTPSRYYRIFYENLVLNPIFQLKRLMSWLDLEIEDGQINFNDQEHQKGLEDPKVSLSKSIHSNSIYRWQKILTTSDVNKILSSTADLWNLFSTEVIWNK